MKLFSRIMGSGQPFLILHGLFGMSDNWHSLGVDFSDYFEVHLIDQRNHGRSPHHDVFNHHEMSLDLEAYIDDHNLSNVILLGHSLGGKVAMTLAVNNPGLLEKLIIVDISPRYYPVGHETILKALQSLDFSIIKTRREADASLSHYINQKDVRNFLLKNLYWKEKKQLAFRFNLSSISANISLIGESLPIGSFFNKPTFFIDGADSNYIQEEDEDLIFNHFPAADICTIPDSGHWVHADQPKLFYENVLNFSVR